MIEKKMKNDFTNLFEYEMTSKRLEKENNLELPVIYGCL